MNEIVKTVCKIGQGITCCRYLSVGHHGFECLKNTSLKVHLDHRVKMKTIVAQGDNCEGKSITELNEKDS